MLRVPSLLVLLGLAGCGRTELVRYSLERPDAAIDAGVDAGVDAGRDAGFDAGFDAGVDAGCTDRPITMTAAVPTVMFVIDRSGSMDEDLDGTPDAGPGQSRWEVMERSLSSVLPGLDQQIAMGMVMYPVAGSSCTVPPTVDLSPALGNANALLGQLRSSTPLGGTPTSGALGTAATHVLGLPTATAARALVLATDGAPNCNGSLDQNTCTCTAPPVVNPNCDGPTSCLDDRRTIASIDTLFQNRRLPTYVIGLGSQLNQFASTLDAMAVAGGVPRMGVGPRYYSVTNQAQLTDAFTRITGQLTRCTYLVPGVGLNERLVVRLDGVEISEGPAGWQWLDRMKGELVINGMPCDRAAMGALVDALVDCDAP